MTDTNAMRDFATSTAYVATLINHDGDEDLIQEAEDQARDALRRLISETTDRPVVA